MNRSLRTTQSRTVCPDVLPTELYAALAATGLGQGQGQGQGLGGADAGALGSTGGLLTVTDGTHAHPTGAAPVSAASIFAAEALMRDEKDRDPAAATGGFGGAMGGGMGGAPPMGLLGSHTAGAADSRNAAAGRFGRSAASGPGRSQGQGGPGGAVALTVYEESAVTGAFRRVAPGASKGSIGGFGGGGGSGWFSGAGSRGGAGQAADDADDEEGGAAAGGGVDPAADKIGRDGGASLFFGGGVGLTVRSLLREPLSAPLESLVRAGVRLSRSLLGGLCLCLLLIVGPVRSDAALCVLVSKWIVVLRFAFYVLANVAWIGAAEDLVAFWRARKEARRAPSDASVPLLSLPVIDTPTAPAPAPAPSDFRRDAAEAKAGNDDGSDDRFMQGDLDAGDDGMGARPKPLTLAHFSGIAYLLRAMFAPAGTLQAARADAEGGGAGQSQAGAVTAGAGQLARSANTALRQHTLQGWRVNVLCLLCYTAVAGSVFGSMRADNRLRMVRSWDESRVAADPELMDIIGTWRALIYLRVAAGLLGVLLLSVNTWSAGEMDAANRRFALGTTANAMPMQLTQRKRRV
jgi:hypothetical protein